MFCAVLDAGEGTPKTYQLIGGILDAYWVEFASTVSNATVINKLLTGFVSGPGPIAETDNILQAIQKLDGNVTASSSSLGTITGNAAAYNLWGNNTGSSAAPGYFSVTGVPVAGDVSGTLGASSVDKLKGTALSIASLNAGDLLKFDGTHWVNTSVITPTSLAINATNTATDASAALDISSTTQGMLVPRMTADERAAIASPATGLMVYQNDATAGFYFFNGSAWTAVGTITTASNGITANNGNVALGGVLMSPTTIATDATNTLKIAGLLSTGIPADNVILSDATTGALKQKTLSSLLNSGTSVINTVATGKVSTTVNGVTGTAVAIPNEFTSSVNTLSSTVAGGTAQTASIINSNTLGSAVNTITSVVNGVTATAPAVNSVFNTVATGQVSTTVNGVPGPAVSIPNVLTSSANIISSTVAGGTAQTTTLINSNMLTTINGSLVSTLNGIPSSPAPVVVSANNGLTVTAGNVALGGVNTVTAATTVTQDADVSLTFKNSSSSSTALAGRTIVDGTFQTKGAVYGKVRTVTALPIVWAADDYLIRVAVAGAQNLYLPDPATCAGRIVGLRNASVDAGATGNYTIMPPFAPVNNATVGQNRANLYISDGIIWIPFGY